MCTMRFGNKNLNRVREEISGENVCLTNDSFLFNRIYFLFQHAAEVEKKQNESETKKCMGSVIQYGNVIQVGHASSMLYCTIILPIGDSLNVANHWESCCNAVRNNAFLKITSAPGLHS